VWFSGEREREERRDVKGRRVPAETEIQLRKANLADLTVFS
jgi:hypothetical protein